ncbi:MAG: phosphoglycerate transporter [Dehalococcoidia bacterium]|nr:phosphoglycerate transporter [Dehalococcoidia bacterium]
MTLRIGWYTTRGRSSRAMFEAVLDAIRAGTLDAEIAYVFSNRDPGDDPITDAFFDLVRAEGIPLLALGSVAYRKTHGGERSKPGEPLPPWREAYDREVARLVDQHPADLGVLAGYMLIFTAEFTESHPLVNLHPALPGGPVGTWTEVILELLRSGASESGVMLNVAIPEVDMGPVVAFCRYPIQTTSVDPHASDEALEASPAFEAIRAEQVRHESPFLVAALQAFATGRASLGASDPLDLTEDVRARLAAAAGG